MAGNDGMAGKRDAASNGGAVAINESINENTSNSDGVTGYRKVASNGGSVQRDGGSVHEIVGAGAD